VNTVAAFLPSDGNTGTHSRGTGWGELFRTVYVIWTFTLKTPSQRSMSAMAIFRQFKIELGLSERMGMNGCKIDAF
jgi:hypothetical protein